MGVTASSVRPEVVADLKNTTAFTHAEICELYRQFHRDCSDKNTLAMNKKDFHRIYREVFPKGDADKFSDHVFRTFDKDGNGSINFRDFMTTLSVQLRGTPQQKIEWAFDLYDIKRNGYISREEAHEMIKTLHDLHMGVLPKESKLTADQLTEYIFKRADESKDNKISKDEFTQAAIKSKTFQSLLEGSATAASSPYTQRRERSGSFGKPRSDSK